MTSASSTHPAGSHLSRLFHTFFAFEPQRHTRWEGLVLRSGLAGITWLTIKGTSSATSQPHPHGLAALGIDFAWIGRKSVVEQPFWILDLPGFPALGISLLTIWAACLVIYALGFIPVLSLLPPLAASISHGVLGNSQGAIGHTTQIVSMALLAAWLSHIWSWYSTVRGRPLALRLTPSQLESDWVRQVIISTYVVSALTKLWNSGFDWLSNAPYFALQMVKSQGMAYHTHLQHADGPSWLAQAFFDHPWIARVAIGGGLPLELFAFVALLNRKIALIYGSLLLLFHHMLTEVMSLGFLYHKYLLFVFFINPWWVLSAIKRRVSGCSLPE